MDFQPNTDENDRSNPLPASKEEREAHFYARHALAIGERLGWTDERRHPWPRKDRINWIVSRLAEVETQISQCKVQAEKERLEQLREDYKIWLLKEREGRSWAKIVQIRMEELGIPGDYSYGEIEALKSAARRAYERVERKHPGSALYEPEPLNLEGCCPNCGYPWF